LEAAKEAGEEKIMAIIAQPDVDSFETAIILNMQRENLNPIDATEALDKLLKNYKGQRKKCTHEYLAKIIGWKRERISELLSLNDKLPKKIKDECRNLEKCPKSALIKIARLETDEEKRSAWEKEKNRKKIIKPKPKHDKNSNKNDETPEYETYKYPKDQSGNFL